MQKETDPPTIGLLISLIIMWLISIPLFLYFAYLCGLSLLMIYEKVYPWAKSGINIDLNSYGCIVNGYLKARKNGAVFIVAGTKKVYFQEEVRQALVKEEHLNHLVYDMLKNGSN